MKCRVLGVMLLTLKHKNSHLTGGVGAEKELEWLRMLASGGVIGVEDVFYRGVFKELKHMGPCSYLALEQSSIIMGVA